ncbi:MAG TPA: glucoamylase family protein [Chitinophagaceae bacterium]|nr:glucoamylase family protein [Chitinophagaceae bacterium]
MRIKELIFLLSTAMAAGCGKHGGSPATPSSYSLSFTVDGTYKGLTYTGVSTRPLIKFSFTAPVTQSAVQAGVSFSGADGSKVDYSVTMQAGNTIAIIQPAAALGGLGKYVVNTAASLSSSAGGALVNPVSITLLTGVDSTDKFPRVSDSALLTLVEQQMFKYFWDFGHPACGMARERNTSGDVVTTGGTGFGIMAMLAAVERNFISRADALNRITQIVTFLSTKCTTYHGAFSHWINGATGVTVPFSPQDNGGDIVETAYMMQGLLCARQYFNRDADNAEINLRNAINDLWNGVDWNWYRNNNQNVLYWNWSPDQGFAVNVQVNGWDEALITYVLAASSNTHAIPATVYTNGWAKNGSMRNGKSFYGIKLSLGPDYGGPLFFAHYSFLGINPNGLSDAYANYWTQDTAQTKINYHYCVDNPNKYAGYSTDCWGLTASDIDGGYNASSPTNDKGYIAPTAAISSLPYAPKEAMDALRFFYYKLGDKIWGQYGFSDAFNINSLWFANSYLAIDQGPQIVMIENYRSGLLWKLFMSCPEVKTGLKSLGFSSPYL